MFKKIEIWLLYLIVFLGFLFAIGFGSLVRQELVGSIKLGWVSKSALKLAEIPMNTKKILINISAHKVEDRFINMSGFVGTPNSKEKYLLLSRYDGDLKEGVVELVNLENFDVLHTWNPDIDAINKLVKQVDEFKYLHRDSNNQRANFNHPLLLQDGGLLFQSTNPLRKIDACSNLIFQNTHDKFHHSIEKDIDENIWTASILYPQTLPIEKVGRIISDDGGFRDDAIVKLSPNGKILFEKSVSQIFIDNNMEYLIFGQGTPFEDDPIHINDIQPVNIDGEFWKKGDVFLSVAAQSMIILYRPSTNKILWKGVGQFSLQHDVDILDNHRISVFNNRTVINFENIKSVDAHNEVIIYDFKNNEYSSYLKDSLDENDVRTISQGRSQILPNGDLFIEETDYGRTLYFNADGSLRWTHINRAENENVYGVAWSRILYNQEDIQTVQKFLERRGTCNE